MLRLAAIEAFLFCLASYSHASEPTCIYNKYGAAIALITYSYKDDHGGSDSYTGSGFVITGNGYIVTAANVVQPQFHNTAAVVSEKVTVQLGSASATSIIAAIVTKDPAIDLALIKVPALPGGAPYVTVPLGDSSLATVGDSVTGIGFPVHRDITLVPTSLITAPNSVFDSGLKLWWQTGLSLNPGEQGAPVFGSEGTVIGVAIARTEDQLISFVTPIQYASALV
jgi:S1-C subfamily serine protease